MVRPYSVLLDLEQIFPRMLKELKMCVTDELVREKNVRSVITKAIN